MFLFTVVDLLLCLLSKCVFSAATWERVPSEELTKAERKHISEAWLVFPDRRHVDFLLDDRRLHDLGFIVNLTEARRRKVEKTLSKKSKPQIIISSEVFYLNPSLASCFFPLAGKITETAKGRMADKGRAGERKKKRVIRAPPILVDEEELLEVVPPLKRTQGDSTSVSVAIAGGSS